MARTGRIARLPWRVRRELNRRLRDGEKARALVEWLHSLPEVQTFVNKEFEGRPLREQNISEWRKGGYRDWLAQQVALEEGQEMCDEVAEMERKGTAPVTDEMAAFLSAHYAVAVKRAVRDAAGGSVDLKTLRSLCEDVVALRRGDQDAEWLELERRRLEFDEEHSLVRYRKQTRLDVEGLLPFLDRRNPALKEAFSAYVQEVMKQTQDCFGQNELKPKPPSCPTPDEIPPDPGKSE